MLLNFNKFISPQMAYHWAKNLTSWLAVFCFLVTILGLCGGLLLAPPDYQQGEVFRIIYIHVPAAVWSLGVYAVMTFTAVIFLVWKVKVADAIAKVSAPIGACLTALALLTGAIWGKPTWGTFWIWDARLTSELILLFIYLGIMALRAAMPDPQLGAKAASLITIVGVINLPIIHYSVDWWQTLHQGATLLKLGQPSMSWSMLWPLLVMIVAFGLYYLCTMLLMLQHELLQRERQTQWVRHLLQRGV